MAHYALGAAGLDTLGVPRRRLALVSLWAAAADLDAIPALVWTLLAPHLPLGADALRTGAHLFGHRGLSHTFTLALVVGVAVWALTRSRRSGLAAGGLWAGHVVLDAITEWPTRPLWPLTDAVFQWPLVTTVDPLLTVTSLAATVALLGPVLADALGWPGTRRRARLDRWSRRWGSRLVYASLGAIAFSASIVGAADLLHDEATVLPANAPRTASLDRPAGADVDAWTVTTRWLPGLNGEARQVPYVANRTNATPAGLVSTAECALERMGPFAPVEHAVWTIRKGEPGWVVSGSDLIRNATGGGPQVHVAVVDGAVHEAWITDEEDPTSRFRVPLPSVLWEEEPCP